MAPTPQQLDDMVRQMYGADAWMLDIPEVRTVLEQAAANLWDQATLESKIRQTDWWKTTTQAQEQYQQLKNTSPAEINFGYQGSQAQQMYNTVQMASAKAGVFLSDQQVKDIAQRAMEFKWNDSQINWAISGAVSYNPNGQTNAGALVQQLRTQAAQYLMPLTDQGTIMTWAQGLTAGTLTMQQWQEQLKNWAIGKYPGMAQQLKEGLTPQQVIDPYQQEASRLMEVGPSQIDFINNPRYAKILQYVDPTTKEQRMMTTSEMATYLRSLPEWGKTQQARDAVGTQVKSLLTTFGVIAQ